ncbi:RabGAP/TBC [Corynespora cassiicola Philippines]|uniref:RabGAP/TBC n=1 Tax=Corynespora cassiicola Philippines TaxID=1448308 RepID=A0A2T2NQ74_CORCC|nr:RabGAP/TBC [Corynespora cassiicola Philippines]
MRDDAGAQQVEQTGQRDQRDQRQQGDEREQQTQDHAQHDTQPFARLSPTVSNATSASTRTAPTSRGWLSSVRRPKTSPGPKTTTSSSPAGALKRTLMSDDDARRDSALASNNSTTSSTDPASTPAPAQAHVPNAPSPPASLRKTPSLPAIVIQHDPVASRASHDGALDDDDADADAAAAAAAFAGIDTVIPTGGFDDLTSPTQVSFSNRGSMLLGGKRANKMNKLLGLVKESDTAPQTQTQTHTQAQAQAHTHTHTQLSAPLAVTLRRPTSRAASRLSARRAASNRVLSADEMMLSRKVRSMYKHGDEAAADWDDIGEESTNVSAQSSFVNRSTPVNGSSLTVDRSYEDASSIMSARYDATVIPKEPTEAAGGLEDWADMDGGEVDRYGFIIPKKHGSRGSLGTEGLEAPEEPRIQRVSTALQLVSEEPRRRGVGRSASRAYSARSTPKTSSPKRRRSVKSSRAPASIFSSRTSKSTPQKSIRSAANRLPHNRNRRLLDEASDMLKLPPGLADVAEQQDGGRAAQAMRAKEIEREEKWRKMAKVVQAGAKSGGMMFEFDIKDPKVISRTWKGIPDRWRATAWYAFLAVSAKQDPESPSDEDLFENFYALQEESSADDMQIDVDVPRTINRHIMFRRRYRGGQRLLFRVLHAMSLYLPDTGYVQGMAALAATLLCYYEEDKAFVMLVRLWMLRGLERLYESGFAGLMEALGDFEDNWLRNGDVAKKLEELGITSTAYGTRWYLTLFNYSLPFPAQLRVWDVFMLLGDASRSNSPTSTFSGDLDVLHATSAALIDATREILLDSDFENAMKVLTSWIPIKDEDLLMRVAKTEYKMRKKRAAASK